MSKKHFQALAEALAKTRPLKEAASGHLQWQLDCRAVAKACRTFNDFAEITFLEACCK